MRAIITSNQPPLPFRMRIVVEPHESGHKRARNHERRGGAMGLHIKESRNNPRERGKPGQQNIVG
jgi:hypothetical protein